MKSGDDRQFIQHFGGESNGSPNKMAIELKRKHGIILALSLTIVLLIGCISLVSYQMYKTALKSFSVQDTSTNLPEKMTDSNTIFNTTETPLKKLLPKTS